MGEHTLRAIVRGDEVPYSGSLSGESRRAKYTCHKAVVMSEPVLGKNKQLASWKEASDQKENVICRSIRRIALPEENGPEAIEFEVPNTGELRFPTGSP